MRRTILALTLIGAAVTSTGCGAINSAAVKVPPGKDCPDRVVVQTWWWPQAENASMYAGLIPPKGTKPAYTVDSARKRVTGPLYDNGVPTGITLEVRAGGQATGYVKTPVLMRTDRSILLGQVDTTDQLIGYSAGIRTRVVLAPLTSDPIAVMWDADRHPDWHTIQDIGRTDASVYATTGSVPVAYLVGAGMLKAGQVVTGDDGNAPNLLLTHRENAAMGFTTNELGVYQNKGIKHVGFQLVPDANFPTYRNAVVVRESDVDGYQACLRRLIPALQRAGVTFATNPGPALGLISDLNTAYGQEYSLAQGRFAVARLLADGIIGQSAGTPFGAVDPVRLGKMQSTMDSILRSDRSAPDLPAGITGQQLGTNEFLDPSVRLPL